MPSQFLSPVVAPGAPFLWQLSEPQELHQRSGLEQIPQIHIRLTLSCVLVSERARAREREREMHISTSES